MTTQDREDTRPAWDNIAPGYDKTNTPTQMWLGNEGFRRAPLALYEQEMEPQGKWVALDEKCRCG